MLALVEAEADVSIPYEAGHPVELNEEQILHRMVCCFNPLRSGAPSGTGGGDTGGGDTDTFQEPRRQSLPRLQRSELDDHVDASML